MRNFLAKKVNRVKVHPSCSSLSSSVLNLVLKEDGEEVKVQMKMVENYYSMLKLRQIQIANIIEIERIEASETGCISLRWASDEEVLCRVKIVS